MQFKHLIQRLKPGASVAESERRVAWRINRRVDLVAMRPGGQQLSLHTINVGPGGMRVEAPVALKAGEEVKVRVARGVTGSGLPAKVVWCRKMPQGDEFAVGLLFAATGETGPAHVESLLEACGVRINHPHEQRRSPRVRTVQVQGFLYTEDDQVNSVEVLDIAMGGALVACPRHLEPETRMRLRVPLSDLGDFESAGRVLRVRHGDREGMFCLAVSFHDMEAKERERLIQYLVRQFKNPAPAE